MFWIRRCSRHALLLGALCCSTRVTAQGCRDGVSNAFTCSTYAAAALDDTLSTLERQVRDSLTPGVRQLFDSAESAWRAYRSVACRPDLAFAGIFPAGSDSARLRCVLQITQRRKRELHWYLTVATAQGPDAPDAVDPDPLDPALVQACTGRTSTEEEEQCLYQAFTSLRPTRDSLVARISAGLSAQGRSALVAAVSTWEVFARANCRAGGQAANEGGSEANVEMDMCLVYSRQRQVMDLQRLESALTGGH